MAASLAPQAAEREPVLVVDDEVSICDVLGRTLEAMGHPSRTSTSAQEALAALAGGDFALVLSDIRMPGMDGVELLRRIVARMPNTAVMMVTAVLDVNTAVTAMRLGACDYVVKPFDLDNVAQRVEQALGRRRRLMREEWRHAQLEREVVERTAQARRMFQGALHSLAAALGAHDGDTHGHSQRVTALAVALARQLRLDHRLVEHTRLAGMLHDIGKIGIRESVLNKPGALSDDEYAHIKTHPVISQNILEPVLWEPQVVRLIRSHHERYDGAGYPDGLAGQDIPLGARVLAVADAFDAMTSERPYRSSMTPERAREVLREGRGSQWDPAVVDALEQLGPEAWRLCRDGDVGADHFANRSAYGASEEETAAVPSIPTSRSA
jgi:putative nucleotidyltransferase with HDIG domain